jgi:hypothetical protein
MEMLFKAGACKGKQQLRKGFLLSWPNMGNFWSFGPERAKFKRQLNPRFQSRFVFPEYASCA